MSVMIYGLHCPVANSIRYVGKTENPEARLSTHVASARSGRSKHHAGRWIRKLLASGQAPTLIPLQMIGGGESWQLAERRWISFGRSEGWPLTNSTEGGEGLVFLRDSDRAVYSANMSSALKRFFESPDARAAASRRMLEKWNDPSFAVKQRKILASAEARARMSESARRAGNDPEKCAARLETMRSVEHRKLRSQISKITSSYPGAKEKVSSAVRAHWADPAAKERHRESLRKAWVERRKRQGASTGLS